ncbi:MAG: lysylphosphatidylglycerol synthase domain-containing protein [Solirubrobacteraceae bacterium]|nr:MAG: TIGR00374 family protein [Solirubrobacterales bacterium]
MTTVGTADSAHEGTGRGGALEVPEELGRGRLRSRILTLAAIVAIVIAIVTLAPGLGSLRARLAHLQPSWLALGAALKLLSGLSYVLVFRAVFCRRMSWRVSTEIGLSELGANAVFPTGGAGGLALGAWVLRRGGMSGQHIAKRTVAFFLLTSVPNVVGVIVLGVALALGAFPTHPELVLALVPAVAGIAAIAGALLAGRAAAAGRLRFARRASGARGRSTKVLGAIAEGVDEAVMLLRRHDRQLILGAIGYLAFDVMILWATFRAVGASPALEVIWFAYLIGELGGLLPLPGGIGGVDAGLIGTLVLYGAALAPTTAAVLAYRAIALWVPAVAGGIAFITLRRTLNREAHQIAMCEPGEEVDVIGIGPVVIGATAGGHRTT